MKGERGQSPIQAAGRPDGKEGATELRAWVRKPKEGGTPQGTLLSLKGGSKPKGRACFVKELPEGGCLTLYDDGTHRVNPKLSPPEGEGWAPLHDEANAPEGQRTGGRQASRAERQAKAKGGERREARKREVAARTLANASRGGGPREGRPREGEER